MKVRRLRRRLKASIPSVQTTSHRLYNILHICCICNRIGSVKEAFSMAKGLNRSGLPAPPKGLIGPPCHGEEA
jgi:hypothetical protein